MLTWHRPMVPAAAMQTGSALGMPARTSLMRRRAELASPGNCPKHMSPASRNASNSLDKRCFGQVDLPLSVFRLLVSSASPTEETPPCYKLLSDDHTSSHLGSQMIGGILKSF